MAPAWRAGTTSTEPFRTTNKDGMRCLQKQRQGIHLMPHLDSKLNTRSEDFQSNTAAMQLVVDDLRQKIAAIAQGGGEAARNKHLARGKLLPRERVQILLDPGTPFLEFSQMAAFGMYQE